MVRERAGSEVEWRVVDINRGVDRKGRGVVDRRLGC